MHVPIRVLVAVLLLAVPAALAATNGTTGEDADALQPPAKRIHADSAAPAPPADAARAFVSPPALAVAGIALVAGLLVAFRRDLRA